MLYDIRIMVYDSEVYSAEDTFILLINLNNSELKHGTRVLKQ